MIGFCRTRNQNLRLIDDEIRTLRLEQRILRFCDNERITVEYQGDHRERRIKVLEKEWLAVQENDEKERDDD